MLSRRFWCLSTRRRKVVLPALMLLPRYVGLSGEEPTIVLSRQLVGKLNEHAAHAHKKRLLSVARERSKPQLLRRCPQEKVKSIERNEKIHGAASRFTFRSNSVLPTPAGRLWPGATKSTSIEVDPRRQSGDSSAAGTSHTSSNWSRLQGSKGLVSAHTVLAQGRGGRHLHDEPGRRTNHRPVTAGGQFEER